MRFQVFSHSFKSTFQLSLAVLSLLSDLHKYLGLAVNPAVFRHPIQDALLFGEQHGTFTYGTITLYCSSFQNTSVQHFSHSSPPHLCPSFDGRFGLPLALFARCYWGYHNCFLLLLVLRCFNSQRMSPSLAIHVFTLGNPGFKARMRLTQAYRSLPRPSSLCKPSYPSHSIYYKIKSPVSSQLEYIFKNVFALGNFSPTNLIQLKTCIVFLLRASLNILCMIREFNRAPILSFRKHCCSRVLWRQSLFGGHHDVFPLLRGSRQ